MEWFVAEAHRNSIWIAAACLREVGFGVRVPRQHKVHNGSLVMTPLIPPYFFLLMERGNLEHEALAKRQRGMRDFLYGADPDEENRRPEPVPALVVDRFERTELNELGNVFSAPKVGREDLIPNATYRIVGSHPAAGMAIRLIGFADGTAILRNPGGPLIKIADRMLSREPVSAA